MFNGLRCYIDKVALSLCSLPIVQPFEQPVSGSSSLAITKLKLDIPSLIQGIIDRSSDLNSTPENYLT